MKHLPFLLLLAACKPEPIDTDTTVDTDDPVAQTDEIATVSGALTWDVDFDATAEAAGYTDCTYTRSYGNGAEIRHSPWLCPDCDLLVRTPVSMTEGEDDCYGQFATGAPSEQEFLGWGDGRFFRTYYDNYRLSEQGLAAVDGSVVTVENATPFEFEADGTTYAASFVVTGELTVGTTTADPMDGLYAPDQYACGWPKADPPAYDGPWELAIGQTIPDGVFRDGCGEPLRLHDLAGRWLVLDVAAIDCGPCQSMARGALEFEEGMAAEGIDVMGVTLLAPSLGDPLSPATTTQLTDWASTFDVPGPVLSDHGYGIWVLGVGAEELTGEDFGYPTWALVSPDLLLVEVNVGFGTWDQVAERIRANQ